jgi:F-type H+-transporting ATPase subunit b
VELNWSTFILEIINFLVLVWILKRFLYKPVLDVIARRRAGIEKSLAEAEKIRAEAEALEHEYQGRLAEWEKEREEAREKLAREIDSERSRRMESLQTELAQQQEKNRISEKRRQADIMHRNEETALRQGGRFAARLLELGCGPETEARLVEMAIHGLERLSDQQLAQLRNNFDEAIENALVTSAFPLPDDQRLHLAQVLEKLLGTHVEIRFEEEKELLAGIRIRIKDWIIGMNLQDELEGFRVIKEHDQE